MVPPYNVLSFSEDVPSWSQLHSVSFPSDMGVRTQASPEGGLGSRKLDSRADEAGIPSQTAASLPVTHGMKIS